MQDILIAVIGSSAFTVIINTLVELLKNRTGRKSKTDKALTCCLLYNLQQYGETLIAKPSITLDEFEQFEEMYQSYKALGGNGFAERIKKEVNNKPITH